MVEPEFTPQEDVKQYFSLFLIFSSIAAYSTIFKDSGDQAVCFGL